LNIHINLFFFVFSTYLAEKQLKKDNKEKKRSKRETKDGKKNGGAPGPVPPGPVGAPGPVIPGPVGPPGTGILAPITLSATAAPFVPAVHPSGVSETIDSSFNVKSETIDTGIYRYIHICICIYVISYTSK
jgi:hypothetical protein